MYSSSNWSLRCYSVNRIFEKSGSESQILQFIILIYHVRYVFKLLNRVLAIFSRPLLTSRRLSRLTVRVKFGPSVRRSEFFCSWSRFMSIWTLRIAFANLNGVSRYSRSITWVWIGLCRKAVWTKIRQHCSHENVLFWLQKIFDASSNCSHGLISLWKPIMCCLRPDLYLNFSPLFSHDRYFFRLWEHMSPFIAPSVLSPG